MIVDFIIFGILCFGFGFAVGYNRQRKKADHLRQHNEILRDLSRIRRELDKESTTKTGK
jgi:hypothetical protein